MNLRLKAKLQKTYAANANPGYLFSRWDIEAFDGSRYSKTTSSSKKIDVAVRKLPSSESRVNAYVSLTAVFEHDDSWTMVTRMDGTVTACNVTGTATNAMLHTMNDSTVTHVTFGTNVTGLEASLFKGCQRLVSVHMNERMLEFGSCVFEGCISLVDVTFT